MTIIGFHLVAGEARFARVKKDQSGVSVETTSVKPLDIEGLPVVTGLEASQILCREVSLKLTDPKKIRAVLPFQVESLIPFSPEETVLFPYLSPGKEETVVTIFATKKEFIKNHVEQWEAWGISPVATSSVIHALARFARWKYPEEKNLALLSDQCCVILEEGRVVSAHPFTEQNRMIAYVKAKFPQMRLIENLDLYAVPIGLALDYLSQDDFSLQLLQKEFLPQALQKKKKKHILLYLIATTALSLSILAVGSYQLSQQRKELQNKFSSYTGESPGDLEKRFQAWKSSLAEQKNESFFEKKNYLVSDVLSYLSSRREDVAISQLHYSLINPSRVKIDLEFSAKSPSAAREFQEFLKKKNPLLDTAADFDWSVVENTYKTTFYLRPKP